MMGQGEISAGEARLHIGNVAGCSTVLGSRARNPLRLLTPRSRGESVWAYTSSFGGGMVAGDQTRLEVRVDAGARCFLGTQASTKIYRNPSRLPCSHELIAAVADEALLILAPDPVQCFADSSYEQHQRFVLAPTGNLLLVDWFSAGRTARGERWKFRRYLSRNIVERMERPVNSDVRCGQDGPVTSAIKQAGTQRLLHDALLLDVKDGPLDSRFRGGPFNCLATVALIGPRFATPAQEILDWVNAQPIAPRASHMIAASPLRDGALLRIAGVSVEEVGRAIHERVGFVRALLNDDPWERKW